MPPLRERAGSSLTHLHQLHSHLKISGALVRNEKSGLALQIQVWFFKIIKLNYYIFRLVVKVIGFFHKRSCILSIITRMPTHCPDPLLLSLLLIFNVTFSIIQIETAIIGQKRCFMELKPILSH